MIDPGDEVTRILELLGRHRLTVKAIVSTHAHIDHVGGLSKLRQYTGAPILNASRRSPALSRHGSAGRVPRRCHAGNHDVDQLLKEGDALSWGSFQANVMHTPGHTPGSVCLYLPKDAGAVTMPVPRLFAGDTLFAGSIGRTDLWGGSMDQITDSLRGKLMQLPDETVVYPGHGRLTSIGQERNTNPFLITT